MIVFSFLFILLFSILIFHSSNAFAEIETLRIKTILVTDNESSDECTDSDKIKILRYGSLAGEYLWTYNIDVKHSRYLCISGGYEKGEFTASKVNEAIKDASTSNDLIVIILEKEQSKANFDYIKKEWNEEWIGYYRWSGEPRTIVTQTDHDNILSESSVWTLSHELSHFALEWYGYPYSIFVNAVHQRQDDYYYCWSVDESRESCRHLWLYLEGEFQHPEFHRVKAMYPLYWERYGPIPTYLEPSSLIPPEEVNPDEIKPPVETFPEQLSSEIYETILQVFNPSKQIQVNEGDVVSFQGRVVYVGKDNVVRGVPNGFIMIFSQLTQQMIGSTYTNNNGNFIVNWKATTNIGNSNEFYGLWNPRVNYVGGNDFKHSVLDLRPIVVKLESGVEKPIINKIEPNISLNIPDWIKNNARWWSENKITDSDFKDGIKYLINERIIKISTKTMNMEGSDKIPPWIRNTAKWWAQDKITNMDFVKGIEYLVENGIIRID